MKKLWLLAGLALVALAFSAGPLAAQEKILKVGVQGPFTGPIALTGQEFKVSAEMALENINYKIGDYKLEVVWIDDQCDPAKATAAFSEAIDKQGVDVAIMNFCSSVGVAVMDVVADAKIPHMFGGAATELMNEKYRSNPERYAYASIKGWPVPATLMQGYLGALEEAIAKGVWKPAKKTFAIFGEDTDWGRSCGGALKELFAKNGWEIVSEDFFPFTQTDYYSLLNRWRSQNVALIGGTLQHPGIAAMIKQAQEIGLQSMIIADGMGWVGNWFELTGAAGEGIRGAEGGHVAAAQHTALQNVVAEDTPLGEGIGQKKFDAGVDVEQSLARKNRRAEQILITLRSGGFIGAEAAPAAQQTR